MKVTVLVEVDGHVVSGFPLVQRVAADQILPWSPFVQAPDDPEAEPPVYTPLPTPTLAGLKALVLRPDGPITVRFAAQTDAGLPLEAGSLLILLGCDVGLDPETNVTLRAEQETAIRGLAAGVGIA